MVGQNGVSPGQVGPASNQQVTRREIGQAGTRVGPNPPQRLLKLPSQDPDALSPKLGICRCGRFATAHALVLPAITASSPTNSYGFCCRMNSMSNDCCIAGCV
jgi:hypothetical protein